MKNQTWPGPQGQAPPRCLRSPPPAWTGPPGKKLGLEILLSRLTSSTQTIRALVAAMMCPLEFLVTPPSIEEKLREKPNQGLEFSWISRVPISMKFQHFQKQRLLYLRSSLFTPSITSSLDTALIAASLNLHISSRLDWETQFVRIHFTHSLTVTHFSLIVVTRLQ